eukprot:scaffold34207_cov34-Prasinocladus_malaysianus.AAC.2
MPSNLSLVESVARFEASFERHVDWVNDIELLGGLLVSCSSDRTVNVWEASSTPGSCMASFHQHSDYVTCLSAARHRGWVASAGLRGEIVLWDLQAAAKVRRPLVHPPLTHSANHQATKCFINRPCIDPAVSEE